MSEIKQPYYLKPTTISDPLGNNGFSYEQRKAAGSPCILSIPQLVSGFRSDILPGENIVLEERHNDTLVQNTGLRQLIQIVDAPIPTYVLDNHNHALYVWGKEYKNGTYEKGITLIHIDQHADMGEPSTPISQLQADDLPYLAQYTNETCNVGNFIIPAQQAGFIDTIQQIRSTYSLFSLVQKQEPAPYILDIDIDFRSDHTPTDTEKQAIKKLYAGAKLCTIALSPYFMPLETAISVTKLLFL